MNPDAYFAPEWRRREGAGSVYQNLIHDIVLMVHLCESVAEVRAYQSASVSGNEVEVIAAVILRFTEAPSER